MTTVTAKQKKSIAQVQLALKLLCVPTEFHLLTSTNGIRILDIQIHIKKVDGFLSWKKSNKLNMCLHEVEKQLNWKHVASGKRSRGNVLMK